MSKNQTLHVEYRSEDSPKEALNAAFGVLADDFERICDTEVSILAEES